MFTYSFEVSDFLILNLHTQIIDLNVTDINLLLSNNLNKYHPYIFYVSSILFLLVIIIILQYLISCHFQFSPNSVVKRITLLSNSSLIINTFALFLGSYWALQEGTWGGWWNWDPSEVFGLLFFTSLVLLLHSNISHVYLLQIFYKFFMYASVIVFAYFLIQLNFDLVSHNFGTKFFYFFNNNLFLLESVILSVLSYIYFVGGVNSLFYKSTILILETIAVQVRILFQSYLVLLYTLTFILIFFSFVPMINYFVWYDITINYYDLVIYFNLSLLLFLLLLTATYRFRGVLFFSPVLLALSLHFNSFLLCIPFLIIFATKFTNIFHMFLTLTLISNTLSHFLDFISFSISSECDGVYVDNLYISNPIPYYNCDNFFIESVNLLYSASGHFYFDWNIMYQSNSFNNHPSLLLFNNLNFFNFYTTIRGWLTTYSFIEINYLNNLYDVFVLLFVLPISFYVQKQYCNFRY